MDKKKIYLIIGGAVLAIALVIALVVGLGGNKTETPNGETTTPIVNESVGDNGGETTTPEGGETTTPDGTETTNPGGETTTPNGDESTTPDGEETTKPNDETTKPDDKVYEKGDVTDEGYVYYPEFDIEDPKELDDFIKEYSPREDITIVKFVDGEWEGLVSREDDVVQVVKQNDEEKNVTLYFDSGETIVTQEKYDDDGNVVYSSRESSDSNVSTESHYNDGVETRTVKDKKTGVTKTLKVKTTTINGTVYQRLIYIDTGRGMVQSFEYADFANGIISKMTVSEGGKTYTWNMDGKGNDVENIVSLTIGGNTIPRKDVNLMEYTTPPGQINNY